MVSCLVGEWILSDVGVVDLLPSELLNSSEGSGGTVVLYTLEAGEADRNPDSVRVAEFEVEWLPVRFSYFSIFRVDTLRQGL